MPLPSTLISASLVVCERILQEADNTVSLIRVVDIFEVPALGGLPVEMYVNATCKFQSSDKGSYRMDLRLVSKQLRITGSG